MLSFFPRGVLDKILNLIESVSKGFPSYSCIFELLCLCCMEILINLPIHSFNVFIIPILRDSLSKYFFFFVFLSFDVYLILTLVILGVARCYLWLFTLYINIKIGKNSCLMLD